MRFRGGGARTSERAQTRRQKHRVTRVPHGSLPLSLSIPLFLSLSLASPLSLALGVSISFRTMRIACLYSHCRGVLVVGIVGRRLTAHGRRFDLELLSRGVGTFMPYQRGIRDEFNSDWSLSITSSLSGPFSLFAAISTALTPFHLALSCYNCA